MPKPGTWTYDVIASTPIAWYASAEGGRVAFNITTGIVPLAANATEQSLAAFQNPTGSGKDIFIDMGEFGCSLNGTFRRYRNSTFSGLSSPISATNMGGGSATSVAAMYVGGTAPTFTRTGGNVSKTAHIAAFNQYLTHVGGKTVLRPGNTLAWSITGPSGNASNFTASVYFEYWELPAA